jgi:poly(A) polymerase
MKPRIIPRPDHIISRANIDPDALKILIRLRKNGHIAYLVGGGVRDLLLERAPKDFDISTSAHPAQIKKLFRNCFIIGRRFRLCHIRFGRKVIEVSTFRRQATSDGDDPLIQRDNTFGTPEEDAFRRDFGVNALFYDVASFSVIDYVGGLKSLEKREMCAIGDPVVRFAEDPVRMLRAVSLACRLDFSIERNTLEGLRATRGEITKSSPARILEEFYKILRQGAARKTFESLHETGLLAYLLPEASKALDEGGERLLGSLARLDAYRNAGRATGGEGDELTNPLLMGTLLVPLGVSLRRPPTASGRRREGDPQPSAEDVAGELERLGGDAQSAEVPEAEEASAMPFARRDLETLRLILAAQRRLRDPSLAPGAGRALAGKKYFEPALRWLEIHGGVEAEELAAEWRRIEPNIPASDSAEERRPRRRRRRRRGPPPPADSSRESKRPNREHSRDSVKPSVRGPAKSHEKRSEQAEDKKES